MDRAITHSDMNVLKINRADEGTPAPAGDPAAATAGAANADRIHARPRLSHVGRYALRGALGEDAYGGVYEGWDPLLSREVAIRTLQFGLKMSSRIAVDRLLLQAARTASELSHRHIVAVHGAGLSAHGVYLVMERLKGRDMRRALEDGWCPSVHDALVMARRLADGLAYAHARAVRHGDVEPQNIFITRNGRPKLMHVGLAPQIALARVPELDSLSLFTPHYLAPEQLAAGHIDERTDIYSLGVVLYEMLTGRKPFRGETVESLRQAIANGQHVPLRELRPELPAALLSLVASAMAVQPADRPASAAAFSAALRRLAEDLGDTEPGSVAARAGQAPARRPWSLRWPFAASMISLVGLGLFPGPHNGA